MNNKTSLSQSIALREAELPQDGGEYYWCETNRWANLDKITRPRLISNDLLIEINQNDTAQPTIIARAFTVGELIEWLLSQSDISSIELEKSELWVMLSDPSFGHGLADFREPQHYKGDTITTLYEAALWWAKENNSTPNA